MDTQRLDFDPIPVRDTHVLDPLEQRRLSKQSAEILARLQQGPATNSELAQFCLNSRARISDLRKAGYDIRCVERNIRTGYSLYVLEEHK